IFGLYFLVPFGLALAVLLLEGGLRSRRPGLIWTALAMPVVLLLMVIFGHRSDAIYQEFLRIFTARLGADPLYCTLLASAAFYAYAALRRVGWAIEAMAATLAILALVKPAMLNVPDFGGNPTPLILAATLILGLGIWQRQSWRCLAGSFGLVLGLALALPTEYRWPIVFHVLL